METVEVVHVKGGMLAKVVLIRDEIGVLDCIIPYTYTLKLETIRKPTGRKFGLTNEKGTQS